MRALVVRGALPLALALAACSDFESLDRGVCGNGLIEAGEDCDSSDPSCVRCAVTCDEQADCPTSAYACGTDGLCHAPGGTLAPPAPAGPFQVNDFQITDIGGDGTGDVIGLSRTSIVVKTGDVSGQLSTSASIVTPFQTGRPAFGDLDGDGSLDITMTTPDGLVSYTSPLGELTPLPVQSRLGEAGAQFELVGLYHVSNFALGSWLASTANDTLLLTVFDLANSANDAVVLPCNQMFKASAFSESSFHVYRLSADTDANAELLLAFTGTLASGTTRTCAVAITKAANAAATITDITPLGAQTGLVGRPVFADLDFDGDRCPSLMSFNAQGSLRNFDGSRGALACTLPATSTQFVPANATPGATLVGQFPLTPQIALVAPDALVLSDGVYASTVIGPQKVYTSPRSIARIDFGDLNGDGRIDGVVASEGEDDIDILFRTQEPGYQLVRLDTASRVTSLTVGDYDGNGIEDVAYTELLDEYQRLEVSFSTTDRPLDPVTVGAFPNNISIVRLQIPDSLDPQGLAADLAVLTLKTGSRPPTVTALHGSSQRTMLPYYDPIPASTGIDSRKTYQFRGAVVGRFAGDDALADIVGLGVPLPHLENNAQSPIKAWSMRGTPLGPDGTTSPGKPVGGLVECTKTTGVVCIEDAKYVPWSAGGHDEVYIFDRTGAVGVTDPASINTTIPVAKAERFSVPGAGFHDAFTADLLGDEEPELVAVYERMRHVYFCTRANDCRTFDDLCEDTPGGEAVDAAAGRFGYQDPLTEPARKPDLIVLCRYPASSAIVRLRLPDENAGVTSVEELVRVPGQLDSLRVGDVTGDGLDDIAALRSDHGALTLEVFRQCSSRDVNTCRGGGP